MGMNASAPVQHDASAASQNARIAALLGWVTSQGASRCASRPVGMSGNWCAGCRRAGCPSLRTRTRCVTLHAAGDASGCLLSVRHVLQERNRLEKGPWRGAGPPSAYPTKSGLAFEPGVGELTAASLVLSAGVGAEGKALSLGGLGALVEGQWHAARVSPIRGGRGACVVCCTWRRCGRRSNGPGMLLPWSAERGKTGKVALVAQAVNAVPAKAGIQGAESSGRAAARSPRRTRLRPVLVMLSAAGGGVEASLGWRVP